MKIYFRVLSVDENENSFVVRYYTDNVTEDDLAMDFDVDGDIIRDNNGYPIKCRTDYNLNIFEESEITEENITKKIIFSAPIQWLQLKDSIKTNNNFSFANVAMLINQTKEFDSNTYIATESL